MAQAKLKSVVSPKIGQLIECRGATWRYVGEQRGFWHLELLKEGAQFAENPVKVWILPHLESGTLKLLESSSALAPRPEAGQKEKGRHLRPFLQSKRNHSLGDAETSAVPNTAMHCAIAQKPWQFEPWQRMVNSLAFPRVLIADDVGLGKTTEAAIILAELTRRRRAERVLIITPQHLTEKWQDELYERFGLPFEIYHRDTRVRLSDRGVNNPWEVVERVIVSRDFVKRWENLKALENVSWDIVIIDECHHFVKDKGEAPTRLRELAEKIVYNSPGLILLSATPFTGSRSEFHSLLRLLDPKFHDEKFADSWDPGNPYLIRRLKGQVKVQGEKIFDRKIIDVKVTESDLGRPEGDLLREVGDALANYRSSPESESWDRLLEETARKRLSSSWGAFSETVAGSGRIGQWFSDSLKAKIKAMAESPNAGKFTALLRTLQGIHRADKSAKVVIFTEAIATQTSAARFLIDGGHYADSQVAEIRADTPRDSRLDIEDKFANPESDLRILIATDTISEGKDLQHACNHLIHLELPWSLVKIEQRNGRIDRLGQEKTPHIYNIVFDTKVTPDQNVLNRLMTKLDRAREALGSVSPIVASFDSMNKEDLFANDAATRMADAIDVSVSAAKDFGFDLASMTSLCPAPEINESDFESRRQNLKLMLEALGGKLEPYGKASDQYALGLPTNPAWELPGLSAMGDSYPTNEDPWRVTFNPQVYLEYERYRRVNGESRDPLHFISPVHPVTQQIEARFRSRLADHGYPVFAVDQMAHDCVLVVELTARSPSSRILSQRMCGLELRRFTEVPLTAIDMEVRGIDASIELPTDAQWRRVDESIQEIAKKYVGEVKAEFDAKKRKLDQEQALIPEGVAGNSARKAWIADLWSVDPNQIQYQIIALLVSKRS